MNPQNHTDITTSNEGGRTDHTHCDDQKKMVSHEPNLDKKLWAWKIWISITKLFIWSRYGENPQNRIPGNTQWWQLQSPKEWEWFNQLQTWGTELVTAITTTRLSDRTQGADLFDFSLHRRGYHCLTADGRCMITDPGILWTPRGLRTGPWP